MRIPCAKCGYVHDSTVTPFTHDNIRADVDPINFDTCSLMAIGDFKCDNCSSKNLVAITWAVIDEKEEKK